MALLEVKDLRTEFDTSDGKVRAVDGVTFEVNEGETVGLVGESGCGKSVTALSLMRLIGAPGAIVGGEVLFDGRNVLTLSAAEIRRLRGKSMAMIFQDPGTSLNPGLTVGLQISEVLQLHLGMDRSAARKRTLELFEMVGIPGGGQRFDAYPHQFSGGMRQRLMIAMALSCHPRLVILDEITTALDMTIQAQILDLLKDVSRDTSASFVLITHDLGIVAGMAQRVHVMYAGQVVEKADTGELFANPRMPYTWGLLRSIPRLDQPRRTKLLPIEGMPPDLVDMKPGCRFEPRCRHRRSICREKDPELTAAADAATGHETRCWGTQSVSGGGWLRGLDWRTASTAGTATHTAVSDDWQ